MKSTGQRDTTLPRAFPEEWQLDLQAHPQAYPQGRMIFLRRTDEQGAVHLLERRVEVDEHWAHRLVRAEVNLDANCIRFYRLRRREPQQQPLLKERPYKLPRRRFHE